VLRRSGLEYISWQVRSCDTIINDSALLVRRILGKVKSRDILLFHDHLPRGTNAMLDALPRIIDTVRERGFEFVLAGSR
jgi:peptidoglycan/xylan/chitin deacetylase (PgdA/CDA1 family)